MTPAVRPAPRSGIPARLEIRDLRLMVAVAAEGSLTAAGARLNVTQPALSRHLATLETRVGTALFARTGQRMVATAAGELLLRHARDVLDRVAATEAELQSLQHEPRRVLRVGTECYTGYHWLPAVLNRYTTRHPNIDVQIAFEAGRQPMKLLRAGDIDVAILTESDSRGSWPVSPLFADEYIAVVAPQHPWATRGYVTAADFANERILLMSPPDTSTVMKRFIRPARVTPRQVVDVQLIGAIAALSEAGFGIGLVPNWTIAPEIRASRLVPLRLGRAGLRRTWTAAVSREHARERWLRDFVHSMATGGPSVAPQPVTGS